MTHKEIIQNHKEYQKGIAWELAENDLTEEEIYGNDGNEQKALEDIYELILEQLQS